MGGRGGAASPGRQEKGGPARALPSFPSHVHRLPGGDPGWQGSRARQWGTRAVRPVNCPPPPKPPALADDVQGSGPWGHVQGQGAPQPGIWKPGRALLEVTLALCPSPDPEPKGQGTSAGQLRIRSDLGFSQAHCLGQVHEQRPDLCGPRLHPLRPLHPEPGRGEAQKVCEGECGLGVRRPGGQVGVDFRKLDFFPDHKHDPHSVDNFEKD